MMTDRDIIKALECCIDCKCKDCPCYNKETDGCKELDEQDILDLINRQKAEIERYEKTVGKLTISKDGETAVLLDSHKTEYITKDLHKTFMNMARNRARAEAIKEFAERLKSYGFIDQLSPNGEHIIYVRDIDDLVKEMVGE